MPADSEPETRERVPVAAVIGATRPSERLEGAAVDIGRRLVDRGFRVATGGLGGVMSAACRGARESAAWREGVTVGVLPGLIAGDANPYVDVVIPTGLNFARNVVLVAMADVVIAMGGGSGTLSEIALAWQHGKPVIALDLGEGWSAQLAGTRLDDRRDDVLHPAATAEEAVALASELVGSREGNRGF